MNHPGFTSTCRRCASRFPGAARGAALFVVMHALTWASASSALAATNVPGGNVGNQTWNLAGSPYNVQGDITVQLGATLTINAGVRTERELIPSYAPENPDLTFRFGDKIAPRVGFAWDIDRKSVV